MRKSLIAVLAVLTVGAGCANASNHESSLKIGVVDLQQVMQQANEVKTITTKLQNQFKPREEKIKKLEKTLKADLENLQRNKSVMKENDRNALETKLIDEKRNFVQMQQAYRQDAQLAQQQAMQKFMKDVRKVVQKIASKESYDIIMQKGQLPFVNAKLEITSEVVKKLNQ